MDNHEYQTLLAAVESLSRKIEDNQEKIISRFDNFKDDVCTPTRITMTAEMRELKVKSGVSGIIGGGLIMGMQALVQYFKRV